MNRISFHDTHVYPGCTAIIFFRIAQDGTTMPAVAEFTDGVTVMTEVERVSPDEVLVRIDAYTTARGTRIPEKTWRLKYEDVPDLWKVAAKI